MRLPVLPRRWFVPAPSPDKLIERSPSGASTVVYKLETDDPDIASRERILITALASDSPRITETINAACSIAFLDGLFPIVVASELGTEFLVNAPMPVELLPKSSELRFLTYLEYSQYIYRRWTIILGKWEVTETLDLASDISCFIAGQMK